MVAMDIKLSDLQALADRMPLIHDDRPAWLSSLPYARDEQHGCYYRFFHELAKVASPLRVLEIGTHLGGSSAHLAFANRGGHVTTIDIDPKSAALVEGFGLENLSAMTIDSSRATEALSGRAPFDVLFIDAEHEFEPCRREYVQYRKLVRDGGIVFFDDIHMHDGMDRAWAAVADPKIDLPRILHYTGFGACKVDASLVVE